MLRLTLRNAIALLFALTLSSACTTLPDTSGFTSATRTLQSASTTAGTAIGAEFDALEEIAQQDEKERVRVAKADFDSAWNDAVDSLDGLVAYAEALEALTDAGSSGGESARDLFGSVQELGAAVGVVPGGQSVAVAVDTLALINQAYANMRARKKLSQALNDADPVIAVFARVMGEQVGTAHTQFLALQRMVGPLVEFEVQDRLGEFNKLKARNDRLALKVASETATTTEADKQQVQAELDRIGLAMSALKPDLDANVEKVAQVEARHRAGNLVFENLKDAIVAWRAAHQQIVNAVEEDKPVDLASLMAAALDVKAALNKWRELDT